MSNKILLEHGSGGKLTFDLINEVILKELGIFGGYSLEDSAILKGITKRIAFTTDSYVVKPIFFPGGDIGKIAICGTVNDLSVSGAKPYVISVGFIIEEGFDIEDLKKILRSMKKVCKEAGVRIVCGDTKVVEKGKADGIYINTSGIGLFKDDINLSYKNPKPGDVIIINGSIASHGIAVMNARHNFGFDGKILSDVSPLNELIETIIDKGKIRCMKDLTRGGLANGLIEISDACGYGMEINEKDIPVDEPVKASCNILGIDPIYVANEGKIVVIVDEKDAYKVLASMRMHKYGKKAKIIGRVVSEKGVFLNTVVGMKRVIVPLVSDQLPRIC